MSVDFLVPGLIDWCAVGRFPAIDISIHPSDCEKRMSANSRRGLNPGDNKRR
jgi:hypothetical protein